MPGWAKALIIILLVGLLLVVCVVGAGVYWVAHNKDALVAKGKQVVEEGQEAGRHTDNQGCVDQSVTRYKTEPGFTNGISSSLFMQSCLESSKDTPGFCDDVPKETEFIKSGQWELAQCQNVGLGSDHYCTNLFQAVQRFCDRKQVRTQSASP